MLKLNLDALTVETFDAAAAPRDDGEMAMEREPNTGHRCSAIDACPTRLCDTSLC
ncbi:MAG TPA: hypothetical protein VF541_09290 [Longimicrobium sp.]